MTTTDIRPYLRGLAVFAGDLPGFDPAAAPPHPETLFVDWLVAAVDAGVREPHAMTLSTIGDDGVPAARVLILKNVDATGWQFAVHAASPKGRDLSRHPGAALTFYWPAQARQIRVRGTVRPEPPDRSAADFLARPAGSRAEASLGRQSRPLTDRETLDSAVRAAHERILADPGHVVPEWTLHTLTAGTVEFWQGDHQRRHTRLRYTRTDPTWTRDLLWP
ncbi:pyridoxamine 5'-phosphate oxidase [Actinoplanes sp. SE50]|uniref:pyridoxine/pyridoxamine 5'-phosphate oxidase n=1 Tax=unclassified Actinoplanes TaxID=2626549 RepID=UPI00023EC244|nr:MULTISPECIES: pyridoxal 5'-phosphate synthase [unclassified Actinoplanes]AEV83019.1 pyridoxamine 5'-phosphate oxidase [Actinoplanes sp. SE50/110]ATO81415.1 pyridoxamine 5'-phosphate oxidase [Actinoplanes sp. SE50]SLL98822.1 pyridoxamine 5'-phosphate oxidase [Actinoplanes sp. SE50/110]